MMTKEQEHQITDYLIFHRLPLDLLLEVKDHMVAQVADLQISKNVDFDAAFLETKKCWADEFKIVSYSTFYREQIPVIVKNIAKARNNSMMGKALLFGLVVFAVNFILIYLSTSESVYSIIFRIYNSIVAVSPLIMWIFYPHVRKYIKRDFQYKGKVFYSIYQQNLGIYIGSVSIVFQLINRDFYHAFRFFRMNEPVSAFSVIIDFALPFVLHFLIIFVLLNFFGHKKAITKIQDFLRDHA
ncbi:hypothetical protein [uncultured Chryseobacterium sp.]|uniref:hypothetical protein n=1 Tax=uncultured Chryseobacterium sp. TaxID=259322 RepID=UPI0025EC9592|nr:hypothetical protein [uncultured Chryseobacterium sp.]